jgi:hypothetical protein
MAADDALLTRCHLAEKSSKSAKTADLAAPLSAYHSFLTRTTTMGLFWDLIQQSQISNQQSATSSLEERLARLENQVREMQQLQLSLLKTLETNFGRDIDGDGQVG